jgi:HSP20 family protein
MTMLSRRPGAFPELAEMRERFERMFEGMGDGGGGVRTPAIDVIDEDDALLLRAEVPGMRPDEVAVELQDDVLTIRGHHEETSEEKGKRYIRRERRIGAFARSIGLPAGTDPDTIEAACKDGVLNVRIPHAKSAEPKTIAVKSEG